MARMVPTTGAELGLATACPRRENRGSEQPELRQTWSDTDLMGPAGRLLRAQDEERRRMVRELHDTTMQNLVGALLLVDRLGEKALALGQAPSGAMKEMRALITRSLDELRRFSNVLHPPLLEELGLVAALRWLTRDFEERTGITVALSVEHYDQDGRDPRVENALFHIVQEALANIHRHSGSATAKVRLRQGTHEIVVEVVDQGKGMPEWALPGHGSDIRSLGIGILSMCARLQPLCGKLQINSTVSGTEIRVSVPSDAKCVRLPRRPGATPRTSQKPAILSAVPRTPAQAERRNA